MPRCLSVWILKARPENGSDRLGLRSSGVSPSVARALDRRNVQRRRQEVHDGVEHGLHALVLERRAAQDRVGLAGDGGAADAGLDLVDGELLALEVLLHDRVVDVGERLDQLLAVLVGLVDEVGRDLLDRVVLALLGLAAPGQRAHADQVDDADVVALRARSGSAAPAGSR